MAFFKLLSLAACLSVSMAAPQALFHAPVVSHATPLVHAASPLVRTFATPAVHTVATPAVHAVATPAVHAVAAPVLRTVAPVAHEVTHIEHQEEVEVVDPHPQYNFGYSVQDAVSGDFKDRQEARDGDLVTGSYTVADPDGRIRHVEYTADAINGFQAHVTYDGAEGPVAINNDAHVAVAAAPAVAPAVTVAHAPAVVRSHAVAAAPTFVGAHTIATPAVHAVHTPFQAVRAFPAQTLIHA